jgi:hypothetical protein
MRSETVVSGRWRGAVTALVFLSALVSISCGGGMIPASNAGANGLTLNTSTVDFGNVSVGGSKNTVLTLTNSSEVGGLDVTFSQVAVTGPGFSTSAPAQAITLTPGQTSTITITFAPKAAGAATGSLSIMVAGALDATTLPLTGIGVGSAELAVGPSTLAFGSVATSSSATLTGTLTAGSSSITVSNGAINGQGYSLKGISFPLTVAAGTSVSYSVVFAPQGASSFPGSLTFVSNAANSPATQNLTGTGTTPPPVVTQAPSGNLVAAPSTLAFGSVTVGSSKSLSGTLTAGSSSITVSSVAMSGPGYSLSGISFPATVAAGTSISFTVTFAPQSAATSPGSISFVSNAANSPSMESLTATGTPSSTPNLTVSPAALAFGSVAVGSSKNMTGTLTAGSSNIAVASAAWTGQGYSVSGISFPVTVAAGTSISYTVTFAPQAAGSAPGGISFASNASNSPGSQTFSGSGAAAAVQHTVELSWAASVSTVTGYNVYRGTQSGGPYVKLSSTPQPGTTYADSTVQSGTTYFYVVTSVDDNGVESAYSNEAAAVVPTP